MYVYEDAEYGNLAVWVEREAGGDPIVGVVIGTISGYDEPGSPKTYDVIPWSEARPILDYGFELGYCGGDCHAIYAWTPSKVIFVSQYDGSKSIESIPRDPVACTPIMVGGGKG